MLQPQMPHRFPCEALCATFWNRGTFPHPVRFKKKYYLRFVPMVCRDLAQRDTRTS